MEGVQQRSASRRFWQEAPVTVAPTPALPPAVSHGQRRHRTAVDRDRIGVGAAPAGARSARGAASTTAPAPTVSPSRVSGAGSGSAGGGKKEDSPELRKLAFTVQAASYSCPDGPSASLAESGRTSYWKGGAGVGWVLLRLHEKSLLSFLRVRNRSTSEISVSISVRGIRRRDFVKVKRGLCLAHGTTTDIKIGHLPCTYIRVEGTSRGAGSVSLHELVPVGIPARCVGPFMGPCMEKLTYRSTERLLFGPSLRTSLAPVCSRSALQRLMLPPTYLRAEGMSGLYAYDSNGNDPDPIRKGPPQALLPGHRRRHRSSPRSRSSPAAPPPPPLGLGGGRAVRAGAAFTSPPGVGRAGLDAGVAAPRAGFAGDVAAAYPGVQYFRGGHADGDGGRGGGVVSFDDDDEYSPTSYNAYDPRGEGIGDGGVGEEGGSGGGGSGAFIRAGGIASAADADRHHLGGRNRSVSRSSGATAAGGGSGNSDVAFGYVDGRGGLRQPVSQQQQRQQQNWYGSGGVGRQVVGARTGGHGGGESWPSTAVAAGDARGAGSPRWSDHEEKEATGNEPRKNGDPHTFRRRRMEEDVGDEEQGVGFGFGYAFGRRVVGRTSPYTLGRHEEGEEEEEEEEDDDDEHDEESESDYDRFARRSNSGGGGGGNFGRVPLAGRARGIALDRRHRHAAAA